MCRQHFRADTSRVRPCLSLLPILALLALGGCSRHAPASRDWSPDAMPEAYAQSVAALMAPGATRAFQVTSGGDLTNGAWWVHVDAEAGGARAKAPRTIAYEDRWCPVVRWTRTSGAVTWTYEAVAVAEDEPGLLSDRGPLARAAAAAMRARERRLVTAAQARYPEERIDAFLLRAKAPFERDPIDRRNLLVSLRVEAVNHGPAALRARSRLTFGPLPDPAPFVAPDSGDAVPWSTCWGGGGAAALGWGEGRARGRTLETELELPPGERRAAHVVLSAYPVDAASLRRQAAIGHGALAARIRGTWHDEVERGAQFDVPDPDVRDAIRAARVQLLALRERRLREWVPIGGPFHYRDVWLRDGARAMQALALSGYTREARELAESFLRFQWPHGPFVSQRGQLDGTGQALWAFEQVFSRPAVAHQAERFAAAALTAWRALERSRVASADARDGTLPGLLPATHPRDNEMVHAQLVGNDAWAIAGYRATARLLRAVGRDAAADSVERAERDYRAAFERALQATGHPDLPTAWQGGGIDWGNLAVGYPCMALRDDHPRLARLARRYWARTGGAGLGYSRHPDSLHGYVGADLATWAWCAGERGAADSVLDQTLAWRSASGGGAELFAASTRDFGVNFPPHPTTAAAILTMVRNALIHDDGDRLRLTLGARASWWRGTSVRRAPTRFGAVDLEFRRERDAASWRWTPVSVWTELALPPGTVAAGPLPQPLLPGARFDRVLAPPGTRAARIALVEAPIAPAAGPIAGAVRER